MPSRARSNWLCLLGCLITAGIVRPAQGAQARVAIAGTWGTGYAGLFARYGMPRERLLDAQLTDAALLARYDLLIVSGAVNNWDAALPVVEQYIRNGGSAILEYSALPSTEVLPGPRIAPQAGPNFVLEATNHPALAGLPGGKTYLHNGEPAAAIVPDASTEVVVLARFTEEGAGDKVRGKFVLNGQSVPAILYRPLGKGHLIYSGPFLGDALAFGVPDEDLVFALVRFLTNGNAVPRLALAGPENLLTTRVWAPVDLAEPAPPTEVPPPEGLVVLRQPSAAFEPYVLSGKVHGPVTLLLDYAPGRAGYKIRFEGGKSPQILYPSETEPPVASAPIEAPPGTDLVVSRNRGTIAIIVNGRRKLEVADRGCWPGAVAAGGLTDAVVQPVEPVNFAEDFMQEAGEAMGWEAVSGNWRIISTEGEPKTGANPFSYGVETQDEAIATAGEWFWDDYAFEASARWTQNTIGLIVNYRDVGNYDLVEADLAANIVRYVAVQDGRRLEGAAQRVELRPWQWHRLGVRSSRGLIVCILDGKPVIEARADDSLGRIGLYARNTKAAFDDVRVNAWRIGPRLDERYCWIPSEGQPWAQEGGQTIARGTVRTAEVWADVAVAATVRMGDAQQAAIRVRDDGDEGCAGVVERTASGLVLKLLHTKAGKTTVVGSVPLRGRKPTDPLRLVVKAVGERVFCAVDDQGHILRALPMPREGAVVLYASGKGTPRFSDVDIRPALSDLHPCDPPTPAYAGAVDIMTWAGAAFSWAPDPTDLEVFWHEADVPGPLRLRVGVHKGDTPQATAEVLLAETIAQTSSAVVARFSHMWGSPEVSVSLRQGAQTLAHDTYRGPLNPEGYLAEVEQSGCTTILRVNGSPVVLYNDVDASLKCRRVGVRLQGAVLCSDDLILERSNVRMYTFSEAPADWVVQQGTWEVTSRWTCAPGWTWLSGVNTRHAIAQSKYQVEGDVLLDTYVGAKMIATPAGRKEVLQDIRLGVCGRPGYLNAGYFFLIGAKGGNWTALQRNGLVVAETSDFVIPQGSVHNDWLRLSVRKLGGEITLLCQGQPVLTYTDPNPLPGGTVSLGTYDNGIMFPRVTVYGVIR